MKVEEQHKVTSKSVEFAKEKMFEGNNTAFSCSAREAG